MDRTAKKPIGNTKPPQKKIETTTTTVPNKSKENDPLISSPEGSDYSHKNHHHRHHHHRRHHHHSRHHHSHHRHGHHHHHHHHHRHRSHTPLSDSSSVSDADEQHYHHHHFHNHGPLLPRIVSPRPPKIITPTPRRITNTTMYRDTAVNTGIETKIMRDTSVTADFDDEPDPIQKRPKQIPVVRRTIIVEPYPAQPSSQIVVKQKGNMVGKIRLGNNTKLDSIDGETIVYPSTKYRGKNGKSTKTSTTVNGHLIENLNLDNVYDDYVKQDRSKPKSTFRNISIKNAFYN